MGFADDIQELRPKVEKLMTLSNIITPEISRSLTRLADADLAQIPIILENLDRIEHAKKYMLHIQPYLPQIRTLAGMTDVLEDVDKGKDRIASLNGIKKEIIEVNENTDVINSVLKMKPMIEEIISLRNSMAMISDIKEEINEVLFIADRIRDDIFKFEATRDKIKKDVEVSTDVLNKIRICEQRIDEKLKRTENISDSIKNLNIVVTHVGSDDKPSSVYTPASNTLKIEIPSGKKGDIGIGKPGLRGKPGPSGLATKQGKPGDKGKDGKNFSPSFFGDLSRRGRYNNSPVGTSYLSLDEIPTMIYFRKSNTTGDWTEGQPFGVSDGGYKDEDSEIEIVDGINIKKLTSHILYELENRKVKNG